MEATTENINQHLTGRIRDRDYKDIAPKIFCTDGESLSIQASRTHYCNPRENTGYWIKVEVGFPSVAPPESWADRFDGDWENEDRTGSVYGYVPIELVVEFINSHGGIDVEKSELKTTPKKG